MNTKIQNPQSAIQNLKSDMLRILILEDVPTDAELVERELRKSEIAFTSRLVDTKDAFLNQLVDFDPDIVLSDYTMPQFNGMEALKLVKKQFASIPLIIVTGSINEETAVECMKAGAADYVLKDKLTRIGMAVKGTLEKKHMREEKKRVDEDLRISARKWRTTFDAMTDCVCLLDPGGAILQCNKAMRDFLERPFQEIIGHVCCKLVHGASEPIEGCPLVRMRKTGCRETIIWANGAQWFEISVDPVLNEDGGIEGAIHVLSDITDRKMSEEALQESEENYRLLVENANDAIFIAQDDVLKFPNPKAVELIGYSAEELTNLPIADLIYPDDRDMVMERHRSRLKGEELPATYSFRIINKAGKELWVQLNTTQITWEERPATLNFLRDITPQKELEDQLIHAQKMEAMGVLAGGIAHDFNNILMAIMGYAEMTKLKIPGDIKACETLDEVLKASHRAKDLVRQIITFSRQGKKEKKPTKVGLIVKEVLKLSRATLPTTIEIRHEIKARNDTVMADPIQIHQILMNLFTNAYHAMEKKGGVLEVSLEDVDLDSEHVSQYPGLGPGSHVKLTVSDTGCGMDQNTLEKIFDPYFTTKEKGVGTGMGLAVVHGIIKNYGGAITVQSELEKGSTFQIFLPTVERETQAMAEALGPYPTGSERILFVDDEETIVDLGKRMLGHLGYDVVARDSSMEALEIFRKNSNEFDLIITDQTMPKMTGEIFAKELIRIRSDIPVILCTGFSEHINEDQAKAIGIRALVMKPFVFREIAATIRRVLDQRD